MLVCDVRVNTKQGRIAHGGVPTVKPCRTQRRVLAELLSGALLEQRGQHYVVSVGGGIAFPVPVRKAEALVGEGCCRLVSGNQLLGDGRWRINARGRKALNEGRSRA